MSALSKANIKLKVLIGAVIALVCALSITFLSGCAGQASESDSTNIDGGAQESEFDAGIENPVNWNEWLNRNDNIYAWIVVDDTNVNLPILQHPSQDNFYLKMNVDGSSDRLGALYSQGKFNSKDLTQDPVTVVYGHTFTDNEEMFTTLHKFEDAKFFEEHPTFYVYTPTQRYTYEVVSAFENDNKHILMKYDMSNIAQRTDFFNKVQNPDSMNKQVRTLETPLDPEKDKLLVLSTCTQPANDNARYLVTAVLRNVEDTNTQEINIEEPEVIEEETLREANA
ncbi:class B sortase [Adlercreutzia sp. ZJ154]|uniref:class B sortase n=1 Tax=Adlercreutzia sp. ZJ154 TaxID=2709790 RepID=UPI0013ED75B1|nr:class B sortase [Adlercreutzia sp. ZJ154]